MLIMQILNHTEALVVKTETAMQDEGKMSGLLEGLLAL